LFRLLQAVSSLFRGLAACTFFIQKDLGQATSFALAYTARLVFTISKAIPPATASAPATNGITCHLSVVSEKKFPDKAITTTPSATKLAAMMVIPNLRSVFFDRAAQPLAAKQQHYDDDDEKEADRAAADIEGTGQNGRE
jgi:hypothetical protein